MRKHRRFLAIAAIGVAVLAGLLVWRAVRGPVVPVGTQCASVRSCQVLAKRLFEREVLVPGDATFEGGAYNPEGLSMDFRLADEDFRTIVFKGQVRCSASRTAPTGRRFCYVPFDNGCNADFRDRHLTYFVIITQDDLYNTEVPRLPQAMAAVASYGAG